MEMQLESWIVLDYNYPRITNDYKENCGSITDLLNGNKEY